MNSMSPEIILKKKPHVPIDWYKVKSDKINKYGLELNGTRNVNRNYDSFFRSKSLHQATQFIEVW